MSKLVIKNEKQLIKFLNILAEQSVQQAYGDMSGATQQQQVAKDIRMSKKTFIEEEDPPADAGGQPAETSPEVPSVKPAPEQSKESDASIAPKFDSLIDAINDLRGAPSSRDSSVETQLRAYYDKLEAAEAASAILFIRTLSQVMKGEVEGAKAPDPTYYQIMTSMGEEGKQTKAPPEVAAPSTPVQEPEEEEEEAAPESKPPSAEDRAPPIKVGGEQVTESYRNKIRALLSRG